VSHSITDPSLPAVVNVCPAELKLSGRPPAANGWPLYFFHNPTRHSRQRQLPLLQGVSQRRAVGNQLGKVRGIDPAGFVRLKRYGMEIGFKAVGEQFFEGTQLAAKVAPAPLLVLLWPKQGGQS